ncbi:GNAT family N-acetyltransferase [Pseudoduganella plicata]|uniref:N-acetyltransferase n=1 Tax=Pseudoduganella plicata TaxID=321984 RepID=A0A4P7BE96_9BURK|nr:GNAT family N-acetyltransferase [Pseudoduganella plicata]QBQ36914.1 N-acetyltransferase [Pseudoduganella plicata]GGZ07569.1 N-acetyltransferase [Pseudoduganella plicata]
MTGPFEVDTDRDRLDVGMIHCFLGEESTWAQGMPRGVLQRAIDGSLCFGVYDAGGAQVAFARVITDYSTFAYLLDVFVLPAHRGQGHSTRLMDAVMAHPGLQTVRRFMLTTTTASDLYARYGFAPTPFADALMERYLPDLYRTMAE